MCFHPGHSVPQGNCPSWKAFVLGKEHRATQLQLLFYLLQLDENARWPDLHSFPALSQAHPAKPSNTSRLSTVFNRTRASESEASC